MAANNKANVSTVRAVKGGYAFSAPVGTAGAPTISTYHASDWLNNGAPPAGWECLGFIVEDGFTENPNREAGDAVRDINLDKLDETEGTADESLTVGFREVKSHVLGTAYGHANVADANGTIEVRHNWSNADEHYQYVFLLLLKDGRAWTKYVPDGKVSEVSERTFNKTTAADTEVTISYNTDEDGNGCFDWIDSTETPAPVLATLSLSGTGASLSPSFDASKHAYTSPATGSYVTVTATAATGKTVAIKDGNGNAYESGNSVPVVTGTNIITVTVSDTETGAKGDYTITVTKS